MSDLEKAVDLVRQAGLATGHADTCADLMAEVLEQVEAIRAERDEVLSILYGLAKWHDYSPSAGPCVCEWHGRWRLLGAKGE